MKPRPKPAKKSRETDEEVRAAMDRVEQWVCKGLGIPVPEKQDDQA